MATDRRDDRSREIAVLGAGALGLTLGYRLALRGERVTIYERQPLPGGLAAGFEVEPGVWLERFYHHLFRTDRRAIAMIEELGLGERLEWRRPVTATLRDRRIHQLDSAGSLLRFRPLPFLDRVRMGAALAFLRALPSPDLLEGRTAASWIRRVMGRRAYDVVWGPLLRAKFGAEAESIALPWFWARVHDRSAELGYIRGGFQQMYDRLAERIAAAGGKLAFSVEVSRIEPVDDGIAVSVTDGDGPATHRYDVVLSTLPVRLLCRLTPALPDDYRSRYEWGRAFGAHCLILSLDRPLTSTYWLNINDPDFPFMALVEHTNYRDPAEYGGRHLLYLGNYRPMDDPLFTADPAEVLATAAAALTRINPAFDPSWIVQDWAFSAPFAQPIVTPDYRDHIPPFETPIPGLWSASMFQVYPHDRGQNYSIDLAERLLQTLDAASAT